MDFISSNLHGLFQRLFNFYVVLSHTKEIAWTMSLTTNKGFNEPDFDGVPQGPTLGPLLFLSYNKYIIHICYVTENGIELYLVVR